MKPPLHRVPGTAIFLNRGKATAPLALRANVEHNEILHENVLILSIETMPVPHVPAAERLQIDDLGYKDDRIIHVTARFGYMDQTNVPGLLPLIRGADIESPSPRRQAVVLRVAHRARPGPCTGHEPLAQAPVHRDITDHRRRRRILPASPRTHRHHGLAHRDLTCESDGPSARRPNCRDRQVVTNLWRARRA